MEEHQERTAESKHHIQLAHGLKGIDTFASELGPDQSLGDDLQRAVSRPTPTEEYRPDARFHPRKR